MFNIKHKKTDGFYEFEISNRIEATGMRNFRKILENALENGEKLKLIGEFHKIPGFNNYEAFRETITMKFVAIKTLSHYAVISNRKWIRRLIRTASIFTRQMHIRAFSPEQRAQAINWIRFS